jgi:hypothetical protein
MLKTSEKNVFFAIIVTALVGFTGMKTSYGDSIKMPTTKQEMEKGNNDVKLIADQANCQE